MSYAPYIQLRASPPLNHHVEPTEFLMGPAAGSGLELMFESGAGRETILAGKI